MAQFGRMPLFSMQTSAQLRAEGLRINLRRLMDDIRGQPIKLGLVKETVDEPHSSEERREQHQ